jgi:hypothetical protein
MQGVIMFTYPLVCTSYTVVLQGIITEDVVHLRKSIGAPGMAVLQFGNELLLILVYMSK